MLPRQVSGSLNSATMVVVQHIQLSLRQPVRITFKLLLQRKDDVDEVDDVLIAHEGLNDRFQVSLIRSERKLKQLRCSKTHEIDP